MKWPEKKIGDLTEVLSGFAFDSQFFNNEMGFKLIRIRDVVRGFSETFYNGKFEDRYVVKEGDFLIGMDGEFNIAKWGKEPALLNQRVCKITVKNKLLDENYLFHFLPKQLKLIEDITPFVTVKHLSVKKINEIIIPLPPLAEQQRIAALLDTADRILKQRESAIAKLDQLAQSVYIECCKNSLSEPHLLGDVTYFYAGNSLPEGVDYVSQDGGYFLMKVSDMNLDGNEKYIYKCKEWTSVKGSNSGTCPSGSIVIPKRGGAIGTNKKRITTRSTVLDPNLMAIKANENFVTQNFLLQWFLNFDLASIANGSSVPQLNKKDLSPLKILVPQLSAQKELDQIAKTIEKNRDEMIRCKAYVEKLLHSLQHQSFAVN